MSEVTEQQWRALLDPLVIADIERQALERAAIAVEARIGNTVYQQAWKIAARIIRSMKP